MLNDLFIFLAKASISLVVFALPYRFFFSRLMHFQWLRGYLLGVLIFSMVVPLIPLSAFFSEYVFVPSGVGNLMEQDLVVPAFELNLNYPLGQAVNNLSNSAPAFFSISSILFFFYLLICFYKTWRLLQNLIFIYRLVRKNQKRKTTEGCLVRTEGNLPAFSFLHYIFLPLHYNLLEKKELDMVIQHEKRHVRQKHTIDLLFFEIATILFWFNPAIYYLRSSIRQIHEYFVDAIFTQSKGLIIKYGELLIKLAKQPAPIPMLNKFSNQHFRKRINMLTKTKSKPMEKLKFLYTLPLLAFALVLCSFFGQRSPLIEFSEDPHKKEFKVSSSTAQGIIIRKISWKGNELYSDEELTKVLGLEPGDEFIKEEFDQRFVYNPEGKDISSLYMDKGYLFFTVEPKEAYFDKAVDLEITVTEGPLVANGKIIIRGNKKIKSEEIMQKITVRTGELFNRSKFIESHNNIRDMGYFNPETININPIPYQEAGGVWVVDLEFTVEEL